MTKRSSPGVTVERRGDDVIVLAPIHTSQRDSKSGQSEILAEYQGPFSAEDKSLRVSFQVYRVRDIAELSSDARQAKYDAAVAAAAKKFGV